MSACKELKVKTKLQYETIERLNVADWLELMQTLQSLSAKIERLPDYATVSDFSGFKLDGKAVKEMIKKAKTASSSVDPSTEQVPEEFNIYGSPYRDPKNDAKRVSNMVGVRNIVI